MSVSLTKEIWANKEVRFELNLGILLESRVYPYMPAGGRWEHTESVATVSATLMGIICSIDGESVDRIHAGKLDWILIPKQPS